MSSLRHSVLEKSLRRSLHKIQNKSALSADDKYSSEIDTLSESRIGISSPSSARVRLRKRKNTKKVIQKRENYENSNKENQDMKEIHFADENTFGQCIAMTDVETVDKDKSVMKTKENNKNDNKENQDMKEINFVDEEKFGLSVTMADVETADKDKTAQPEKNLAVFGEKQISNNTISTSSADATATTNQKASFEKMSKQELTDFAVEYKYKYERLCLLVDQLKTEHFNMKTVEENRVKDLVSVKNKLQENLYQLESDKFSLEEQVEKLNNDNNNLLENLKEFKMKAETKKDAIQKEDFHESILQSPRVLSRTKRRSMLNQTLTTMASQNETKSKESLYEDIIIDQQELLDFYSLLCGISICKSSSAHNDSMADNDEDVSSLDFKCKLQIPKSSHDGIEFDMNLNYNEREIRLEPLSSGDKDIPSLFQTGTTQDADEGYLLQKELLNSVL